MDDSSPRMAQDPSAEAASPARLARAPFRQAVLVCGKCARKLGGGFGAGRAHPLRKVLKRAWKDEGRAGKLRVVETRCLGLCPKRRQVVATAAALKAGRLWVVEPGEDAAAVLARVAPVG
jgi:predicted metal-binding protein